MYQDLAREAPEAAFFDQITYVELTTRLPELLLMRTDKMAMANSIEVRVPFLDKALVEFALGAPLEWKLRDGVSKEPLKRMATEWTDRALGPSSNGSRARALFYRPKSGFSAPIHDWFNGALGRDLRARLLLASREAWEPFVNVQAVLDELAVGPATVNRSFELLGTLHAAMIWRERFGA